MDSSTHRHGETPDAEHSHRTRGRLLDRGWRYDLEVWFFDTFVLGGTLRKVRQRVLDLAELGDGQAVLDVGCGTGTLAKEAAARVGAAGRAAGIDSAPRQIGRARSKARRAGLAIDFQAAAIEALPFPDASFDAVTSTLMMHHLPEDLKRQGLSEVVRVLRPGGRLVVGDFKSTARPHGEVEGTGAEQTGIEQLPELMTTAGLTSVELEDVPFARSVHGRWTGATLVLARKP